MFSWGLPAETGGELHQHSFFHSQFYRNNRAEWQKLCLNTFPFITRMCYGIQLRSEVIISKALKWLEDLSFTFKHDLITEVTKPLGSHRAAL